MYQDARLTEQSNAEKELEGLRDQTDAAMCHSMINAITNSLRELSDEKFS